jgi:hypothetical protein
MAIEAKLISKLVYRRIYIPSIIKSEVTNLVVNTIFYKNLCNFSGDILTRIADLNLGKAKDEVCRAVGLVKIMANDAI